MSEAKITYLRGDATRPEGDGLKIIVHVCNDIGGWGAGFVVALSKRWPQPEAYYREWHKTGGPIPFALGQVQLVEVEPNLIIANLIGQRDIRTRGGIPPVRYEAIREGLSRVSQKALELNASVHMPRIGCGLAGGKWEIVGAIVQSELADRGVAVTVYDL